MMQRDGHDTKGPFFFLIDMPFGTRVNGRFQPVETAMRRPLSFLLLFPLLLAVPRSALAQLHQSARLHTRVLNQPFAYAESVSVSGDWALAGSLKFTPADGSVFFYHRESSGWVFTQEVQNPEPDTDPLPSSDLFGNDVVIEGNLALVGALKAGGDHAGTLFVYELQGSKWIEIDRLEPSTPQFDEGFSVDFAISGERIAVSAPLENDPVHGLGVVYVFDRTPAGWVQTAKIHPPPQTIPFEYDAATGYGVSVDVAGDWLVVGAPGGPKNGLGGGAFVYHETADGWQLDDVLVDTISPDDEDFTGKSVAISENGHTILVGEPVVNSSFHPHTGSVLVFERGILIPGEWGLAAVLKASDGSVHKGIGDQFGESVAIQGKRAVIGAPFANGNGPHAGAAYLFERIGGTWIESARLFRSPPPTHTQRLGISVSIDGSLVLVGDPGDDTDGVITGGAFVFELDLGTPTCSALPNSSGAPAILNALGSRKVADANLLLSVHNAPPKTFGIFFFGPNKTQLVLGDGTLCVGGQIARLAPLAVTGDSGAAMHQVDFTDSNVAGSLFAGTRWSFQFWFRDLAGGPAGSNLSNAVEVKFK